MPIDPKAALEYLGINPEAEDMDLDKFKAHVSSAYVPRAEAHKDADISKMVLGKTMGSLRTKLNSVASDLGVEGNWKDIDPTEGIEVLGAAVKGRVATFQQELEEAKKGTKSNKDIEALQKQYEEAKKQAEDFKGRLGEWEGKYRELEGSVQKREREARINAQWERALGSVKFGEGVSPLAVKGFTAAVRERYAVEFDDEGNPYAIDATTKKRVPNPNKAHDSLSLDDLVKSYADQEKLTAGNPNAGKPVRTTVSLLGGQQQQQTQQQPGPLPARRRVMPTA